MTTLTFPIAATASAKTQSRPPRRRHRDVWLYALLSLLVVGAWRFSRLGMFKSGDEVGYWLGVAGGVLMLLLFSYPLRKYVRFTHNWGKVKWWFVVHMVLGIGGPMLILLHSTFRLGSLNSAVALFSMLVVAASGVVGRFLYLRVHRGLQGERTNLAELQRKAGLAEGEMKLRFRFAPEVAESLLSFEAQALSVGDARWSTMLRRVVLLPIRQRLVYRECSHAIGERLRVIAGERGWSSEHLRRRRGQATSLTRRYLVSVVRVAQFASYVRLFALWHMLHVPFLYLLIVTACFHVFAVHAY
jgi:hypothetical protein